MDETTLSKISKNWSQTVNLVNKSREKVDALKLFAENKLVQIQYLNSSINKNE
jgi:hypothetical protein